MKFLSRLDDFESIIVDGNVQSSGLSSLYIKDSVNAILRIGNTTGDSFITYDGSELSISSDLDLRLTTPTDQDVFLITSSGNIVTTQGGGTFTIGGGLTLENFGAGYLKTDANGVVSIDTDIIEDTLDSVTDRGNTTTNNITVGGITATYGNYSSAVNALYFRTAAANTDYNLITRDSTGNTLFVQSAQSNTDQPVAVFQYGSATVNAGTTVLQVSKDKSYFTSSVGIGTTSPAAKLDVRGGALFVGDYTGTVTPTNGIWLERPAGNSNQIQMYTTGASIFYIKSDGTTANLGWGSGADREVNIQNTGAGTIKVGIGNGAPGKTLDITGTLRASGEVTLSNYGAGYLKTDANGVVSIDTDIIEDTLDSVTDRGATTTNAITVGGLTVGDSHFIGNQTTYDNLLLLSSSGENIVLSSANDLYFNTGGTSAAAAGNNRMFISGANGNVGIGTTNPNAQLEIRNSEAGNGVGGATLRLTRSDITSVAGDPVGTIEFYSTDADTPKVTAYIKSMSEELYGRKGSLAFGVSQAINTDATEAMRISDAGNVGIGTTSPFEKLHVDGRIYVTSNPGSDGIVLAGSGSTNNPYAYIVSTNEGSQDVGIAFYVTTDAGTTNTEALRLDDVGNIQLPAYTAGLLQTDANGNVSLDTNTYLTSVAFSDLTSTPTTIAGYGITDALEIGTTATTALAGDTAIPVSGTDFDPVGTDNSTDVTLVTTSYDYLSITGQEITLGQIDYNADITNLPTLGTAAAAAATDFVAVTGDTMTGQLVVDYEGYQIKLIDGSSDNTAEIVASNNSLAFFSDRSNSVASSDMFFSIDNDTKLYISTAGNVGIGTTNPGTQLELAKTTTWGTLSNQVIYINNNGTGGNINDPHDMGSITWRSGNVNTAAISAIRNTPASGNNVELRFTTATQASGQQTSMTITSGGNVGIGTTSPSTTLTLGNSTDNIAELRVLRSNSTSGTYGFINTVGGTAQIGGSGDTRILSVAASAALRLNTNGIDRLSLLGDGQFWIKLLSTTEGREASISNDNDKLRIFGSRHGGTGKYVSIWPDGANENARFYPTNTVFYKNVGIGTTSPFGRLNVSRAGINEGAISFDDQANNAHLVLAGTDALVRMQLGTYNNGSYGAWIQASYDNGGVNYGTEPLILNPQGGNVGIGTTSPGVKLDIDGGSNGASVRVKGDQPAGTYYYGFMYDGTNLKGTTQTNIFYSGSTIAANTTIAEYAGLRIDAPIVSATGAVVTNNYGIYQSGSVQKNYFAGNVGIGTTNPTSKLHIDGFSTGAGLKVQYGNSVGTIEAVNFIANGGANGVIGMQMVSAGVGDLWLGGSGGRTLTLYRNGNVGIGTTDPTAKLTVIATSTYAGIFSSSSGEGTIEVQGAASSNARIRLLSNAGATVPSASLTASDHKQIIHKTNNDFAVQQYDTSNGWQDLLTIKSSGNVGIGTTSPTDKLQVKSGGADDGIALIKSNNTNRIVTLIETGTGDGAIIARDTSNSQQVLIRAQGSSYINGGNVGIGTTAPLAKLQIQGATPAGSATEFLRLTGTSDQADNGIKIQFNQFTYGIQNEIASISAIREGAYAWTSLIFSTNNNWAVAPTEKMRITAAGNVGIGTSAPDDRLHIAGGHLLLNNGIELRSKDTGGIVRTIARVNSSTNDLEYGWSGAGAVKFMGGGAYTERMRIHTDGNVGIGTTSPAAKLHVVGPINIERTGVANVYSTVDMEGNFRFNASSGYAHTFLNNGSELVRIMPSGNVGIGTASPATKLHVVGTAETRLRVGSSNASSNVVLELRDENSPTGQGTVITYNNATGETYFNNAMSTATTDFHFQSGEYGSASDFFTLSNSGGNSIVHLSTTTGDSFITYEDSTNELAIASDGDLRLTTPTDQDVFYISSGGNIDMTQAGGNVDMGGQLTVDGNGIFNSNVGIGVSPSSSYRLAVNTGVGQTGALTTSGSVYIASGALGVNYAPSGTAGRIDASNDIVAYQTSDKRLKENIKPIENALEKVKSLTGVEFDWIEETKHVHGYDGHDVGVIAQEVQAVLPEAIRVNDTGYLSVRYEKMIALLVEGIKEQQAQIDELKARLDGAAK